MANYVAPISWGLGDLIVSLPIIQNLVATGEETYLIVRSSLQEGLSERISGLAGAIAESSFDESRLSPHDRYYNLRRHPLQTDYFWGSPRFFQDYPGYLIDDILGQIAGDLGLATDFGKLRRLDAQNDATTNGAVLLIPGSDGQYKWWTKTHWLALKELLEKRGLRVMMLGKPDQCEAVAELQRARVEWHETATLAQALDAVSSALAVVAVDTGLMHMAVQQGVKTVTLYRPDPVYLRKHEHVRALIARSCSTVCLENLYSSTINQVTDFLSFTPKTWTCHQSEAERCMASISVAKVMEALESLAVIPDKSPERSPI